MEAVLTVAEAGAYLRADEAFVRDLIREGRIPHVRLGPRKVIIPRQALDEWLHSEAFQNLTAETGPPELGLVAGSTPG